MCAAMAVCALSACGSSATETTAAESTEAEAEMGETMKKILGASEMALHLYLMEQMQQFHKLYPANPDEGV